MFALHWNEIFFAYAFNERSLEDRCTLYWEKYLVALADSTDDELLLEKANQNQYRKAWLQNEFPLKGLRRSKRFCDHISMIEKLPPGLHCKKKRRILNPKRVDESATYNKPFLPYVKFS